MVFRKLLFWKSFKSSLKVFILEVGEYRVPNVSNFEQTELIVFYDVSKKQSSRNDKGKNGIKHAVDEESRPHETDDKENVGLENLGKWFTSFFSVTDVIIAED